MRSATRAQRVRFWVPDLALSAMWAFLAGWSLTSGQPWVWSATFVVLVLATLVNTVRLLALYRDGYARGVKAVLHVIMDHRDEDIADPDDVHPADTRT